MMYGYMASTVLRYVCMITDCMIVNAVNVNIE
jgi:hypothetical protein